MLLLEGLEFKREKDNTVTINVSLIKCSTQSQRKDSQEILWQCDKFQVFGNKTNIRKLHAQWK